ncbi:hypothetical protein [Methylomonas sp. MgM2]
MRANQASSATKASKKGVETGGISANFNNLLKVRLADTEAGYPGIWWPPPRPTPLRIILNGLPTEAANRQELENSSLDDGLCRRTGEALQRGSTRLDQLLRQILVSKLQLSLVASLSIQTLEEGAGQASMFGEESRVKTCQAEKGKA